jgi:hypothetical protein
MMHPDVAKVEVADPPKIGDAQKKFLYLSFLCYK